MTTRSSGKIAFLTLRDGTGYLQAVFPKNEVAEGAWDRFGTLTQEAAVAVTGTVRADARAPGGFELTASDVEVLAPSVEYPISPKDHGTAFSSSTVTSAPVEEAVESHGPSRGRAAAQDFFYDGASFASIAIRPADGEQAVNSLPPSTSSSARVLAQTDSSMARLPRRRWKDHTFGPTFRAGSRRPGAT